MAKTLLQTWMERADNSRITTDRAEFNDIDGNEEDMLWLEADERGIQFLTKQGPHLTSVAVLDEPTIRDLYTFLGKLLSPADPAS